MAVYTQVSDEQLAGFLAGYDAGKPAIFKGIAEGVENSNYYLETDQSRFILTLYEKRVDETDLPFFLSLMRHLTDKGLETAAPVKNRQGKLLGELCGRPAALITFLQGVSRHDPDIEDCASLGKMLAALHDATQDFSYNRANSLSLQGWEDLAAKCRDKADQCRKGLADEIAAELEFLTQHWPKQDALPCGVIHADLFPDNVLFTDQDITGVIDFYFACSDFYAYDLAICLNAWAFDPAHQCHKDQAAALIRAYEATRPLTPEERKAFPVLARGAALRFLLTRLYDWLHQDPAAMVTVKDPLEYLEKLKFHQSTNLISLL